MVVLNAVRCNPWLVNTTNGFALRANLASRGDRGDAQAARSGVERCHSSPTLRTDNAGGASHEKRLTNPTVASEAS